MALPEIPVLEVQKRLPLFPDELGDGDSDVLASLKAHGELFHTGGDFNFYSHISLKPHDPNGDSKVIWMVEGDPETSGAWMPETWWKLAYSPTALPSLEKKVKDLQRQYPTVHWFMFMGHAQADEDTDLAHFYPRGLPSKKRAHGHLVNTVLLDDLNPARILNYEDPDDLMDATLFFNPHGEALIQVHEEELANFGNRFTYRQDIGVQEKISLPRTMFGFASLQEAMQKILELQARVEMNWYETTRKAAEIIPTLPWLPGYAYDPRFSLAPGFAVIIPNELDRFLGGTDNRDPVWVMPFSHASANQVLSEGFVIKYIDAPVQ